jgi:DNA-binding MarR family transcriptional regulator
MKQKPVSSQRMDLYIPLVRDFAARVVLFHEAIAQRLGLHATDVKVLRLLGEKAMSAGELAAHAGLTGAAMTALIDRLEAPGYVKRERDPGDRRRVTVRAVPAKIREVDHLYGGLSVEMARLLSTYNAAEFAVIADYLTKAAEILTEQAIKVRGGKAKVGASVRLTS